MLRPWSPNAALAWMWQTLTGGHGIPLQPEWRDPLLDAILTGKGSESDSALRQFVRTHLRFEEQLIDLLIENLDDDVWRRAGERFAMTEQREATVLARYLRDGAPTFYERLRRVA